MDQSPDLEIVARQLSREALQRSGGLQLHVISASMLPILNPGDSVLVQPFQIQELRPGQIVVFERDSNWITHRLILQGEGHWITKGDASLLPDAPVEPREVIGRVVACSRTIKNGEVKEIDLMGRSWLRLGKITAFSGRLQARLWSTFLRSKSRGAYPLVTFWLKFMYGITRLLHRSYLWLEAVYISRFS